MNWGKNVWYKGRMELKSNTTKEAFSNLTQSWTEFPTSGPYAVKLYSLADANNVSLRIYRMACRFTPALLNRGTILYYKDYHMSKRNLGHWFRRGRNMRDLTEISSLHTQAMDTLIDAFYGNTDNTLYMKYLQKAPLTREGTNDYLKFQGYNKIDEVRFGNKTKFFENFVKGKKSLY